MAFLPDYDSDVFISYSHVDNEPLIEGKPGWVDFFEALLRKRLRVRLRGEINIFRDPQLTPYGKFPDQLAHKLSNTAVFVCVLSPNYIQSEWCLRELGDFYGQKGHDRLIKVFKTGFDELNLEPPIRTLLSEIKDVLDFRFYSKDESSGLLRDLQPEVITAHIPAGLELIDAIAQHLADLLKNLRSPKPAAAYGALPADSLTAPAEQPTVYLAETTSDLAAERSRVKSELLQFNCRVLPDKPLPQDADALGSAVENYLKQARLSVHLVGAHYGTRPELEERSIPHIQYDLAHDLSGKGQIGQLVWMPEGLQPIEKTQQSFVDYVRNNSAEFLRTKLEDLKTEIQQKLMPAETNGWEAGGEDEAVNVCLFCHEQDMKLVAPLYSHLTVTEMFRVKFPLKEKGTIQRHKQLLQAADAVLLYYGSADEDWFVNIWRLIQRHISAGRSKPVLAKGIYAGQPSTTEKELLESEDLIIIKNYGAFTANSLTPFIQRIKVAKGEA